jgi:hypothetical protein
MVQWIINSFAASEERHITGELVKTAKTLLDDPDAEPWMEHLEVLDDPPQNVPGQFGKQRPRIDIEFVTVVRGKRPRFLIEAKRLYRSDSVGQYDGTGGLQMFVDGQYAADWPSAGMTGYVQTKTCGEWTWPPAWQNRDAGRQNGLGTCRLERRRVEDGSGFRAPPLTTRLGRDQDLPFAARFYLGVECNPCVLDLGHVKARRNAPKPNGFQITDK